ncbi:MAG: hypothetical protein RSG52_15580 [Terrisporobacter sp.]|uniref:hypothetical protein n=1 Tax=Terrisporobacter sp. TaxID=1965305 RepID=UPI002FC68A50
MSKNFSKIFLGTTLVCIILLTTGIFLINKEDVLLEDVYGDRQELGNMTVVYQKTKGLYETNEVNITKDKIWQDKFVKEGTEGFDLSEKNLDNRDLLKYVVSKSDLCEDEDEIATFSLMNTYLANNESEMTACIDIKNKETKESQYYEIPVENNIDTKGNTDYRAIPVKYKDNIYLTVLSSVYDEDTYEENSSKSTYNETYLTLYKINLSMESSQIILSKSYDGKEIYTDGSMGFSNGDKSYFITKKKSGKSYITSLFGFNVKTKEITEVELDLNNYNISDYSLDDNKVLLSCIPKNKNNMIRSVLVDLNKNKAIKTIDTDMEDEYDKDVISIDREDGKLYLILGDSSNDEEMNSGETNSKIKYYIYVIDEKTNKDLYRGEITEKNMYNIKFGILKQD